jgi:ADP-heptose:LPS heptosyltransferase
MPKSAVKRAPKRVLVYRLGSLGDTLIALPALHLVARAFPDAERRMLTSFPVATKAAPSAAVLEHTGLVHGYFRYTLATRNPRELFALWWQLLRWRPQVLVYLGGTRTVVSAWRDAAFFRLCGIPRLIGTPLTPDMQFPRAQPSAEPGGPEVLEAEAARLVRNVQALGDISLDDPASWSLHLTAAEHARAVEALRAAAGWPLIAVSVGTKMQSKDWGGDNWRALLKRLAARYPDHALVLCGAREEAEVSDYAAAGWREHARGPAINLCGTLTPRQSAAVMARAVMFLGHDSGPMHLAAAVQIPCVAVFSSRHIPRVWFPYGSRHRVVYHYVDCGGCRLETCIEQRKRCIMSITVDEVLQAAISVMDTLPQPARSWETVPAAPDLRAP